MQKLFNKILVPVDFSARSKNAVEKAIDFAKQYQCSIHLLHIVHTSPMASIAVTDSRSVPGNTILNKNEIEYQFKKLLNYMNIIGIENINAEHNIREGTWDESIIDFVNEHEIDVVLVGQKARMTNKRKMFVNPDKIATATNIPVITVPSNKRLTRLYSIVIPITDFLPVRKLMYGVYIASKYNTTIKLLGIENEKTKDKVKHYLKKAHHIIHENCTIEVEEEIISNRNIAEAVNQFAILNSADLIILNPGTETKMPGLLSSLLGNIIQKYSAPPVLTVNSI